MSSLVDHCEIELKKKKYVVLLLLDGATNLLWATAQNSLDKKETLTHLRAWNEQNKCIPKAIVGDEEFFSAEFQWILQVSWQSRVYHVDQEHHGQIELKLQWDCWGDSGLSWPRHWKVMTDLMLLPFGQAVKMTVWARNTQLTISGLLTPRDILQEEDLLTCLLLKQQIQNSWLHIHLKKTCQLWHYNVLL